MNVLICQPTCNRNYTGVLASRADAMVACQSHFGLHARINYNYIPADYNNPDLFHLSVCIKDMEKADAVVFCTGWEDDRACLVEHYAATQYNKKIYYFIGKDLVPQ